MAAGASREARGRAAVGEVRARAVQLARVDRVTGAVHELRAEAAAVDHHAPLERVDAGFAGRLVEWAQTFLRTTVEVVRKPPKPVPEKVAKIWAEEWAKEGKKVDWQRLMPPPGYVALPRRWVVERTFSWLGQNRRMSKDYERLCASAEAFVYAAMIRLMVRRLARA